MGRKIKSATLIVVLFLIIIMMGWKLSSVWKTRTNDISHKNSDDITNTLYNSEKGITNEKVDDDFDLDKDEFIPSKEEVLEARAIVLVGMTEEQIERLTENIKVANQTFESAYLNENIFDKLEDENSLYWNYFDQKGEIQIGWEYNGDYNEKKEIMEREQLSKEEFNEKYGEPITTYNRFDAHNFIELIEDMKKSVSNEQLKNDLQYVIDETQLAADSHEMVHANNIYKALHDLDYFLLRYGPEDVGVFTLNDSLVKTYYGTLSVYD